MKSSVKKILITAIAVICIAGGTIYALMPKTFETSTLELRVAKLTFTETGTVVSQSSSDVYSLVNGKISSISVVEGEVVKKGDVICIIDSSDLNYEIKKLESSISGYRAQSGSSGKNEQIESQKIIISQNERSLSDAEENMQNSETLYNAGAISKFDYDSAVSAYNVAATTLATSREQLKIIESSGGGTTDFYSSQISASQASIAQLRERINDYTIKSPADGTISTLHIKDTNVVTMQTPIVTLSTNNDNSIESHISTKDIGSVKVGDTVEMTLERRGEDNVKIPGTISVVDNRATAVISALGVEEKRVKVTISFDDTSLKEGYDIQTEFCYYRDENKIIVPKTAIFKANEEYYVYKIERGKAVKTKITKGMELRTDTVVEDGLNAGDRVINDANVAGLKNGARVK